MLTLYTYIPIYLPFPQSFLPPFRSPLSSSLPNLSLSPLPSATASYPCY